jgi:hypothetical protein
VIVPDTVIGADTQINVYPGATAELGDVIHLGGFNAPAENVQLNVLGGQVWAVEAWTGSQIDVIAGSVRAANLLGGRGTMSGGDVRIWSLFAEGRLAMSGGVATRIDTAGTADGPAHDASHFKMTGGEVSVLDATGNVTIHGGSVDTMFFRGGGFVELSGGTIGDDFQVGSVVVGALSDDPMRETVVGSNGRVTVRGGSIGERMVLRNGRTLDYSGGLIGDALQVLEGSKVTIRGSHFLVDGVQLSWPTSGKLVLTERDVALTGLLTDGQPFRFDLNSQPDHGDYFSPQASVTVILVPEPRVYIQAIFFMLSFVVMKRNR